MKKQKTFDCVDMKTDIQHKLQAEFPEMNETEKRCAQLERVRQNPILGPLLEKIRVLHPNRPAE